MSSKFEFPPERFEPYRKAGVHNDEVIECCIRNNISIEDALEYDQWYDSHGVLPNALR